jgi:2-polyprenyl-3-methyl-5-hydroxy-6-metoxy-1,4-benzoquinol methylase
MSQNHFNNAAAEWDQKKRRQELAQAIAENISLLPLHEKMTAMEYGCGTGLVGLALAHRFGSLTMLDTSSGMIEVLNKKIKEMGLSNVTSQLVDLTSERYDGRFDLIFSAMTLHHIDNTQLILKNLCSLLKNNGYLAIADLDSEDGSFHSQGAGEKHHGFNRETLVELLKNLGLSSIGCKTVHTLIKKGEDQKTGTYPVFLLTGQK